MLGSHLGFLNHIYCKNEWRNSRLWCRERQNVLEGLEQKSGSRHQEYIEFSALAWIVIPWKLEQSLVLVSQWLHGNC